MHFAQHLIIGWFIGEGGGLTSARDRQIVAWAGVLPDADVVPYAAAILYNYATMDVPFKVAMQTAFDEVQVPLHHRYTHGIGFVLIAALVAYLLSRFAFGGGKPAALGMDPPPYGDVARSGRVAALAGGNVVVHCFCDWLASGPRWPIYPYWPFSGAPLRNPGSWSLADWRNVVLVLLCLVVTRQYAKMRGRSPVEAFGVWLDQRFVRIVRNGN